MPAPDEIDDGEKGKGVELIVVVQEHEADHQDIAEVLSFLDIAVDAEEIQRQECEEGSEERMRHDVENIGAECHHQGPQNGSQAPVPVVYRVGIHGKGNDQELDIGHDHDGIVIFQVCQGKGDFKEIIEIEQFAGIEIIAEETCPGPERGCTVVDPFLHHRPQVFEIRYVDCTHIPADDKSFPCKRIGKEDAQADGADQQEQRGLRFSEVEVHNIPIIPRIGSESMKVCF